MLKENKEITLIRLRWRFVICFASFYVNIIVWGFISTNGLFENLFQIQYSLSSFKSIIPVSLQIATMSIFSIFSSLLVLQLGVRLTTLFGSLIATISFILAALIDQYWSFCLFYGFFVGIGQSLMLIPAILAIPSYFPDNHVSLATASALSGASIGMFVIPFLLKFLLDIYGLQGGTLLSSLLWLSVSLSGALFGKTRNSMIDNNHSQLKQMNDQLEKISNDSQKSLKSTSILIFTRQTTHLSSSIHFYYSNQQQQQQQNKLKDKEISSNNEHTSTIINDQHIQSQSQSQSNQEIININHKSLDFSLNEIKFDSISTIISSNEISSFENKSNQILNNIKNSISTEKPNEILSNKKFFSFDFLDEINQLFHIEQFRFLIISMILLWSFDETNFLFLIDLLKSSGQSEQRSTLLIGITGIFDLIGQLLFGYLGDTEYLDPYLLWFSTTILSGLTISLIPWIASYGIIYLSILFALHSFFLAAPNVLGNTIMIDIVGIHRFALAYGFSFLISGLTSLFGYPILGLLKDKTKNWKIPFNLVGLFMMSSAFIMVTISLKKYFQRKRSK